MSATREELIEFLSEAEQRGDMVAANKTLDKLEALAPSQSEDNRQPVTEVGQVQEESPPIDLSKQPFAMDERYAADIHQQGVDEVTRGLGRTGRITADAVAAFPLMAMDAGVGARNLYSELSNLNRPPLSSEPLKETYPSYRELYTDAMNQVPGLPPAEGTAEEVVDVIGQIGVGSKVFPTIGIKNPAPQGIPLTAATKAQQAIDAGAKHKVPVYYDDVGGHISKKIGVVTDNVPVVGTGGGRNAQQMAINKSTQKLADKYFIDDDVPELVQKGLQGRLTSLRKTAGKLYDKVAGLVDPKGRVPSDNFDDAILAQMEINERLGTAGSPEVAKILDKYASAPRGNFTFMRELRSQLGAEISDFYKGGSPIGEKGVGALQAVKNALEADMGKFADDAGPAARAAWIKANSFYAKGVVPFKKAGLRQLVDTDEPAKAWRYLISQPAGKARAVKMYKALDPQGRATVRSGLIEDAIEHAKTPKGDISPAKFAQYMERHSNAVNKFFQGEDLAEIKGYQNLMRHVERAGQYAENPPTGNRIVTGVLAGGAAFVDMGTLLTATTLSAGIKGLYQTNAGRNALIAASKMQSGSEPMVKLAKYIAAAIATQSNDQAPSNKE